MKLNTECAAEIGEALIDASEMVQSSDIKEAAVVMVSDKVVAMPHHPELANYGYKILGRVYK